MKEDKGIYKFWFMGNFKLMVNKMKLMKLGECEK